MIITIANCKGGVGKTNIALNLAAAYARLSLIQKDMSDRRVLVIDLDGQANLTRLSGIKHSGRRTIFECMQKTSMTKSCVYKTKFKFDIIPAKADLFTYGALNADDDKKKVYLQDVISEVKDEYDLIFIDTSPSLNDLTANAILAAILNKGLILGVGDSVSTSTDGYIHLLNIQKSFAQKYRMKTDFLYLINKTLTSKDELKRIAAIRSYLKDRCLKVTIREDSMTMRRANDLNKAVVFRRKAIGKDLRDLVSELITKGVY